LCEQSDDGQVDAMDTDVVDTMSALSADVDSYCFIDRSGNICLDADSVQLMETEVYIALLLGKRFI